MLSIIDWSWLSHSRLFALRAESPDPLSSAPLDQLPDSPVALPGLGSLGWGDVGSVIVVLL
jgi:hypothetical protein